MNTEQVQSSEVDEEGAVDDEDEDVDEEMHDIEEEATDDDEDHEFYVDEDVEEDFVDDLPDVLDDQLWPDDEANDDGNVFDKFFSFEEY